MSVPPARRNLALVTGASSGIGLELAREFAVHGFDLIVAAEDSAIFETARALEDGSSAVEAVRVDLTQAGGVDELRARIASVGRPLDAAVLNAGIGTRGAFATDTALETELRIIDLNVRSTAQLAKSITADMVARGRGRILVTSSVAAHEPGAYQAVYNASKAFLLSFALALRTELAPAGVTVTTLMPGPTATPFFRRANIAEGYAANLRMVDAATVARAGYEGLMNGDELVVTALPPPSVSLPMRVRARIGSALPPRLKALLRRWLRRTP